MSTARDLIKGSLRLIGALGTGETPAAEDSNEALLALNQMLDSWSTENLVIPNQVREVFPLVADQSSYTMGSGGDFDTTRPLDIFNVLIQETSTYELPIQILNAKEHSEITSKQTKSSIPVSVYCENSYPLETLNFYPVPSEVKNVVVYSSKPLTNFASLNTTVTLPPGYYKALRYGLAVELAPEYGKAPTPAVINGAIESKENIKRQNIKPSYLDCDAATLSNYPRFNYRTGE